MAELPEEWAAARDVFLERLPQDRDDAIDSLLYAFAMVEQESWEEGGSMWELQEEVKQLLLELMKKAVANAFQILRDDYQIEIEEGQIRTKFENEGWAGVSQIKLPSLPTPKQLGEILGYGERHTRRQVKDHRT